MALRRLDIPGQPVNAPFLIISDELEGLSGSEACVSVRRNVPLRVQPNIAIYMSSLEGKSIAEVGADVALPGLDANENGSTSRSSYVDHEDDSDDEDDLLDFKSAVEAFLTEEMLQTQDPCAGRRQCRLNMKICSPLNACLLQRLFNANSDQCKRRHLIVSA
jgi:hypothetical protein